MSPVRPSSRPPWLLRPPLLVANLVLAACEAPAPGPGLEPSWEVDGDDVPPGWRAPSGPCELDPPSPTRLLLTTTDFVTGALTVVELVDGTVRPDVAEGSADAIPFAHDDRVVLVHRYQLDRLDVLDASTWSLVSQHALASSVPSANPHAVAFDERGWAWVTTFGEPTLRALELGAPPTSADRAQVDLSGFADDDGNPEASLIVRCGDLLFVTAQRLDPGFHPLGPDVLVVVDPSEPSAMDLDPGTAPYEALPLLGGWVRQFRRDPTDPDGLTILALSTGIERIDLRTGRRQWAVSPEDMAEADIAGRLQPQAFDVDDDGTLAYLAAYDADFSQVRLHRVNLHGNEPRVPEPFAAGFDSVERTLELVGSELWYGSTRHDAPGLWRFDVRDAPRVIAGPLPTGLPPYSMVALP
ncbi:YncE family protein [Paraliomyxa miuraensis]|uniref:hypothetical protein n=1 Tax=Paraliomyxa miuraensis TaxID=376150 RepID=UPI002258BACE|nr:hypothetical protein [Paraliomyxa miuraensis]MCX4245447.1 hypothetical protein [Paraliomyxa miuraensis]